MNKRIFYIFFTNLFFLVILYFSLEFIVYSSFLSNDAGRSKKLFETVGFFSNTLLSPIENFEIAIKNASEGTPVSRRIQFPNDIPIVNKNNKGSIILYGCSYTWGVGLQKNEILSYLLQHQTNFKVYNRAIPGYGVQHMLYQLEENLLPVENPSFIIYVFIEDHINRLYRSCDFLDKYLMFYKHSDAKGTLKKYTDFDMLYWHSYFLRLLYYKLYSFGKLFSPDTQNKFLLDHFLQANKHIKKDTKFVIFVFDGEKRIKSIEKSLLDNGISIVYLSDLSSIDFNEPKYKVDANHPNALVWEIITPLLIEKLKL